MKRIDAQIVAREIEALISAYPELAEDDVLRADMVAGETDAAVVLALMLERMREAAMMVDALTARINEIDKRRERFVEREAAMRAGIFRIMQAADLAKMELAEATLSVRPGPPRVHVTDEGELPESFWRIARSPNKSAIRDALKAGQFVPGALMTNGEPTLSVRTA